MLTNCLRILYRDEKDVKRKGGARGAEDRGQKSEVKSQSSEDGEHGAEGEEHRAQGMAQWVKS